MDFEKTAREEQWVEEDVAWEDAPPEPRRPLGDAELEQLYESGTARIITQRNDFLIPQLLEAFKSDEYLNLTPAYQRRQRWDVKQKSLLIESLLMNVPIPPVFLYEVDYAKYEVMDGQQRLSTIREFFGNEFELAGLEKWRGLNGRRWADLPGRIKAGLDRRSMSAVILLAETGRSADEAEEIRRFAFERLNTGGVKLNPQEIRNCIYGGSFNDLLHTLSRTELFTTVWDIPPRTKGEDVRPPAALLKNSIYQQMADCEIVLRYFTIRETDFLAGGMKKSLDNCMIRHKDDPPEAITPMAHRFSRCLETAFRIYGLQTFRLPPRGRSKKRVLSRPLYDAVMVGIDRVFSALPRGTDDMGLLVQQAKVVEERTEALLRDEANYGLLVGRANTRQATMNRVALMEKLFLEALNA